jgi:hypothetical protein
VGHAVPWIVFDLRDDASTVRALGCYETAQACRADLFSVAAGERKEIVRVALIVTYGAFRHLFCNETIILIGSIKIKILQ